MFDQYGTQRLAAWKNFRDSLETSATPFEDVAIFWSNAPFVSPFLDPENSSDWPDPWHLILDCRLDNLAITLGMLYTLKLTQRFMDHHYEIHMSMFPNEREPRYLLIIDDEYVLNLEYREVIPKKTVSIQTSMIWSSC